MPFLFMASVLFPLSGRAQDTGANRADPGEIQRRIEQLRPQRPIEERPDLPAPTDEDPQVQAAPELSLVLAAVQIEGSTVFEPTDFAPLYAEFLARTITRSDLEEIAKRITDAYAEAGYFLSRAVIPPQQVEGGILRVKIVEGFVTRVRFPGMDEHSRLLEDYVSGISKEMPLRLATVERSLLLVNGLPGFIVTDVQVAPADEPGAYKMAITVEHDGADGAVSLDNRGTPEVGRLEAFVVGGTNSLIGLGERLQFTAATVPDTPKELLYGQLSLTGPIGNDGLTVGASVAASRVDAGDDLASQDTESRSLGVTATARYPVILSRREALNLRGALELHELKEDRFETSTFDDSLRVARLQVDYSTQDDWGGTNYLAVEVSRGLDVLGASDENDARLSRSDGDGSFTAFHFDAARLQEVWDRVSLRVAAQGQYALDSLLSFEEFLLGGSQFGRGYDFGELSGEHGLAGSVELRFGEETGHSILTSYQFYSFYDLGAVWNRNAATGQSRQSLASVGGGLRLGLMRDLGASLEVAKPLTRDVDSTGDKGARVFFALTANF